MMTETQAKEKWCPYAEGHINRVEGRSIVNRCIGSNCMMWRWSTEEGEKRTVETNRRADYERAGWTVTIAGTEKCVMVSEGVGYCGLAGKP